MTAMPTSQHRPTRNVKLLPGPTEDVTTLKEPTPAGSAQGLRRPTLPDELRELSELYLEAATAGALPQHRLNASSPRPTISKEPKALLQTPIAVVRLTDFDFKQQEDCL